MSASCSPNPLIPFLHKSPVSKEGFHLCITCSKRKKKTSAKPKVFSPVHSTKLKLSPIEDLHLGIGSGASTLTALQPLIDDDSPFPQNLQKLPQDLLIDPLSRFTFASAEIVSGKVRDSTHNIEYINNGDKYENDSDDTEDGFEWVEVTAENDVDDEFEDNSDERYIYWEGDLGPMTEEEEAELLKKAKKELAQMEMEKKTTGKQGFANSLAPTGVNDNGEKDDEQEALFLEAEAALAEFEAKSHKMLRTQVLAEKTYGEEEEAMLAFQTGNDIEKEEKKQRVKPHKRAVPAIMRSFDRAKIYVKAGNGGNGVVAFRREKYVPFGGPSGGSGGRGGHIYVEADPSMNSLLSFRKSVHFRAGRGSHGQGKSQDGATGEDCIIKVPLGTVIRQATDDVESEGEVLLELLRAHQRELVLPGGRGGRGNAAFKTGRNKTPQLAENGEEGAEMWLTLELKLVADVGIIGVPNAGKSTLLSVISAAQPAIGAYPFTTLLPNLGVVPIGFESSMVVADLPGLLEGAHLGIGLGHEFLRHTERCRVLVHVVDGMSEQPEHEYEAVRLELELFNPALSEKPYVVAFNKMDIPEVEEKWNNFKAYMTEKGIETVCMSAATKMGTEEVVRKAFSLLQSLPDPEFEDADELLGKNGHLPVGEVIRRQRNAPIEEFEIFGEVGSKMWRVEGIGLERFTQMTNWEYFESLKRFEHVLDISGVNNALRSRGVEEGDTVIVGQMEFVWHDTEDILATDWKRSFRGSKLWPH